MYSVLPITYNALQAFYMNIRIHVMQEFDMNSSISKLKIIFYSLNIIKLLYCDFSFIFFL